MGTHLPIRLIFLCTFHFFGGNYRSLSQAIISAKQFRNIQKISCFQRKVANTRIQGAVVILGFFSLVVVIFLALSILSHYNIKKQYAKRLGDLEARYNSLEKQFDQSQNTLAAEQMKTTRLNAENAEITLALAEREKIIRLILPAGGLTPLEVLRMKGLVSDEAIRSARDYIVKSQIIKDVEDVLVEQNVINPLQLQEMRHIVSRFKNRRRPSRSAPMQ